jgi:hypothetical protein
MSTADTNNNIIITTYNSTAVLATEYATSGEGLSLAHLPLYKIAWGSSGEGKRVSETYPLPVQILGVTSNYLGVTFGPITGSVNVSNTTNGFLVVGGPSGTIPTNYKAIPVTGYVQGATNGILLGVTGNVKILDTTTIQGVSGGYAVGVTGGRHLKSGTDSVTVTGYVGICGGFGLSSATDSVRVYGHDGSQKPPIRLFASDGTTLGYSGDALNVNVIGAGISATVTINPVIGVTNGNGLPLKVIGSGVTSDYPIIVKGMIGSGAIEVTATSSLPVGVTGTVVIDDADIITSLESTSKPIVSNLASIKTNTSIITTINEKLSGVGVNAKISEILKPTKMLSGVKAATSTASLLYTGNFAIKTGIHIKSPVTNTETVYIGTSNLSSSTINGYPLEPGESIFLEIDNINKIYVLAASGTQNVHFITS